MQHHVLPLPTGTRVFTIRETDNLLTDFRCTLCLELPEFSSMHETPCCSRIVHPECITNLQRKMVGENRNHRHACPTCRFGERPGEVFSPRSLLRSHLKSALAAALLGEPSRWNAVEQADMVQISDMHQEQTNKMIEQAKAYREEEDRARQLELAQGGGYAKKGKKGSEGGGAAAAAAAPPELSAAAQKKALKRSLAALEDAGGASSEAGAAAAAAAAAAASGGGGVGGKKGKHKSLASKGSAAGGSSAATQQPASGSGGQEWTEEYMPTVEALLNGVAVLALRPHSAPPPLTCRATPLPSLPLNQTIVSVAPAYSDRQLRAFIEYRLREAEGSLPEDAPRYCKSSGSAWEGGLGSVSRRSTSTSTGAGGGGESESSSVVGGGGGGAAGEGGFPGASSREPVDWGRGAGERIALYIALDDMGARGAPPAESRRWAPGRSLAEVLVDVSLWDVEKLEDEVLVVYYAVLKAPAAAEAEAAGGGGGGGGEREGGSVRA